MINMKTFLNIVLLMFLSVSISTIASDNAIAPSHDISYPEGWQDWATIAVSHRTDNNTLRVILGNDIAVEAARSGNTNPWPDGAVLGKVVWKDSELENWPAATAPGQFVHAEFMFKDSRKYAETFGWGWARWVGLEQVPFAGGTQVCSSCHTPVRNRDWVFTDPAPMPK
jgi:Cytochrome P460